jgi:hypothetical protein
MTIQRMIEQETMPAQNNAIIFNSNDADFSWLSNFYISGFVCENKEWNSVEHFFQASKFSDEFYAERIRTAPTAEVAKKLGKTRDYPIHKNWDELRLFVMRVAISCKFSQSTELRFKLCATVGYELIERSRFDFFWGAGHSGSGKNHLGKIIMAYRDFLVANQSFGPKTG